MTHDRSRKTKCPPWCIADLPASRGGPTHCGPAIADIEKERAWSVCVVREDPDPTDPTAWPTAPVHSVKLGDLYLYPSKARALAAALAESAETAETAEADPVA